MTDTYAAFAGAGAGVGLELWRIENLKPEKLELTGKFFTGDSYILLNTYMKGSSKQYNLHFWLGEESSQDERGVAAYAAVYLDDSLGGVPVQFREVQGAESETFLALFKKFQGGIEYLPGGVASGFKHVERDVFPTRLLQLKGKRTVRVSEVPLSSTSLNKGDVFILDAGFQLFIFNGDNANRYEKAKGVEVATSINNDSRGGRADTIIVNDDPSCPEFWELLGGFVNPASLAEGESDDVVPAKPPAKVISLASNSVISSGDKLVKSMLESTDVYVVYSSGNVFVWVGKHANFELKKQAMHRATDFLTGEGLPQSTAIERVGEGNETAKFKSEFFTWNPPVAFGMSTKASNRAADPDLDVGALLAKKEEEDRPVDDGSGTVQIWVIANFNKAEVDPSMYGQFYGGDSYIILYKYMKGRNEESIIYFWLGNESTPDEKGSAALLAKELDDSMGGKPVQVRVTQGKEPAHFRSLFKGSMIIHKGGRASGFKNVVASDNFDADGTALFRIRGTNELNTVGVQVKELASSLNSEDCFVLVAKAVVFAWQGAGGNADEVNVAVSIANILANTFLGTSGRTVEVIAEGSEPDGFWEALGGRGEYSATSPLELAPKDGRLFSASTDTGVFRLEEVYQFDQSDLNDEDVFLLDVFTQLFVWVGTQSSQEEKDKAFAAAHRFIAEANDGRDPDMPIITVQAGAEPLMFSKEFVDWDPEYFSNHTFLDPYAARLKALEEAKAVKPPAPARQLKHVEPKAGAVVAPTPEPETPPPAVAAPPPAPAPVASANGTFSPAALREGVPPGVVATNKEDYLSPADFMSVFGMDKAALAAMPKWKRDAKKKEVGLF